MSDAESDTSKGSRTRERNLYSGKFVSEGKWVQSQWLSARCLSAVNSEVSTSDAGPSKDLAFGKMSSDWDRISSQRLKRKWAHSQGTSGRQ